MLKKLPQCFGTTNLFFGEGRALCGSSAPGGRAVPSILSALCISCTYCSWCQRQAVNEHTLSAHHWHHGRDHGDTAPLPLRDLHVSSPCTRGKTLTTLRSLSQRSQTVAADSAMALQSPSAQAQWSTPLLSGDARQHVPFFDGPLTCSANGQMSPSTAH